MFKLCMMATSMELNYLSVPGLPALNLMSVIYSSVVETAAVYFHGCTYFSKLKPCIVMYFDRGVYLMDIIVQCIADWEKN